MALTGKRHEIALALSTVVGVRGHDRRPKVIRKGDAWALVSTLDRGPGFNFAATWRVFLALGGDEVTAEKTGDELLPLVMAALDPVAYVQQARPIAIQTEGGDMFVFEITARSE